VGDPFAPRRTGSAWAVIFSSKRTGAATDYAAAADEMERLAEASPGYLGMETVRGPDGFGITVSYWESEAAIAGFKQLAAHRAAQANGRERWYGAYEVRVARV